MTSTAPAARRRAGAAIYALGASVIRRQPREMSLTAISTMATLERTGPRRITELAVVQGVSQPSMTSLVSGLERAGLVARQPDPTDGRAALVALTAAGAASLEARRAAGAESMATLLDKLTADEARLLDAALPVLLRLRDLDEDERSGG